MVELEEIHTRPILRINVALILDLRFNLLFIGEEKKITIYKVVFAWTDAIVFA